MWSWCFPLTLLRSARSEPVWVRARQHRKRVKMHAGKAALLSRLTSRFPGFRSAPLGAKVEGSSPPSVFIGSYGYPKVFVGPLLPPVIGNTAMYDAPEEWIGRGLSSDDVVKMRLELVRGKQVVDVRGEGKAAEMAREIALAEKSTDVEAEFKAPPRGGFLHEEVQPFGPSGDLRELHVSPGRWDGKLEKAYYDTDLRAKDAVLELYDKGAPFSAIQRGLSVGALGVGRKRKLVPTRWSITAVDSILSENVLSDVKGMPVIEAPKLFEFESFNNRYAALFYPSLWQYEWIEAFFPHEGGGKASIFSDFEYAEGKKGYSEVGGCYYSAKLAVLEKLRELGRQAGVLILREAYSDYVPLGVWNVRENLREAVKGKPKEFESLGEGLKGAFAGLRVSEGEWRENSATLKANYRQSSLSQFV